MLELPTRCWDCMLDNQLANESNQMLLKELHLLLLFPFRAPAEFCTKRFAHPESCQSKYYPSRGHIRDNLPQTKIAGLQPEKQNNEDQKEETASIRCPNHVLSREGFISLGAGAQRQEKQFFLDCNNKSLIIRQHD